METVEYGPYYAMYSVVVAVPVYIAIILLLLYYSGYAYM